MASLAEHLHRMVDRFWYLPLLLVPSAAVDDAQTEAWSDELYQRDLDNEPQPRTGE